IKIRRSRANGISQPLDALANGVGAVADRSTFAWLSAPWRAARCLPFGVRLVPQRSVGCIGPVVVVELVQNGVVGRCISDPLLVCGVNPCLVTSHEAGAQRHSLCSK